MVFIYRIVSNQSIVMISGTCSEDANSKLKQSLNIEDNDFYFVGLFNHGLIVKGNFEIQYL